MSQFHRRSTAFHTLSVRQTVFHETPQTVLKQSGTKATKPAPLLAFRRSAKWNTLKRPGGVFQNLKHPQRPDRDRPYVQAVEERREPAQRELVIAHDEA